MSRRSCIALCFLLLLFASRPAFALPTMIRLGYNSCAACHLSPQGGGLLTPYGKGIDMAQSLDRRDVTTADERLRSLFDVRFVLGASYLGSEAHAKSMGASTLRTMFRNAVLLSSHTRVSYQAELDTSLNRTTTATAGAADAVIPKALFEYKPREGVLLAIGRDTLPTGVNLPDPEAFMRKQHDPLGTAYPIQAKAFLWTRRFEVTPYAFGPGFDEATPSLRQHGGGVLGGVDLWKQRAVVGIAARSSRSLAYNRDTLGAYARLGFGRWGILGEHDVTARMATGPAGLRADYVAGYTQLFVAAREWFVTSLALDDVVTGGAIAKHDYRLAPTVALRISPHLTLGFSTRDEIITGTGANSRTYAVTIAVKSVQ